jgi:hypothetical protein
MVAGYPIDRFEVGGEVVDKIVKEMSLSKGHDIARKHKDFTARDQRLLLQVFYVVRKLQVQIGAVLNGHGTILANLKTARLDT